MGVNTAAGAKIYIGSEDADLSVNTQGEYEAEVWTEVGQVEDLGEFGDSWNNTTFATLADSRVQKFKTTKDAGTIEMVLGFDSSDAGQAALVAALASKNNYTFKVTLNDASTGSPSAPTTFYFSAQVMSNRRTVGTNENIVRRAVALAINTDVIEVAAV